MPIKLSYVGGAAEFDISVANGRIVQDDTFETEVIVSLFTWARATDDDLKRYGFTPDQNQGFWGDAFPIDGFDRGGSVLWLLAHAKRNQDALDDAERFAQDALAWMISKGFTKQHNIAASWWRDTGLLVLEVELVKADGTRWSGIWEAVTGQAVVPFAQAA